IRLVAIEAPDDPSTEIRCQCEPAELSSSSGYNALSYVWGDAAITQPITLNGFPIRVTTNLWHALVRLLTRPRACHLWIDALCIDQSSTEGKSNQIPLIGKIYSQAEKVLIWIDEEEEDS
ncbi:heterokaryon incompatibility protein-domain-containing protein, partial [Hyaloscypha finlandica]